MANKALEEINDKITKLQDDKRVAQEAFRAFAEDHAKKVAEFDRQLADWAEVLDSYWGRRLPVTVDPNMTPRQGAVVGDFSQLGLEKPARKTAAKKTTTK